MKLTDPDIRYTIKPVVTLENAKLLKLYIKLYKKDYEEKPTEKEMAEYIGCCNSSLRRLIELMKSSKV